MTRLGMALDPDRFVISEAWRPAVNGSAGEEHAPLKVVCAADLFGKPVPPRLEHVEGLIPCRTVTLFSGDGGTGKSTIILQLSCSTSLGIDFLGLRVRQGRVLVLSAEDELEEMHRRLADITRHVGCSLSDLRDLHLVPLAGEEAVLAAPSGRSGLIAATPLWASVVAEVERLRPTLIVLDTLADLFGGDENHRAQARQFVGMLRGLALRHDATVILLAHPSLSGIASGSGTSGTTGWGNSVRSRLYLKRATIRDENSRVEIEPDPDVRVLATKKANYGPVGGEIRLRWEAGVFRLDGPQSEADFTRAAKTYQAETAFLELVGKYHDEKRPVGASPSANYAPSVFAKDPRANGIGQTAFRIAMNALFEAGKIVVEEHGPPSKRRARIVLRQGPEGDV